jgi:hypothetical protein
MKKKSRNTRPSFGKTISVQFLLGDEDTLIREIAQRENRSAANTVRTLALESARRREPVSAQGAA